MRSIATRRALAYREGANWGMRHRMAMLDLETTTGGTLEALNAATGRVAYYQHFVPQRGSTNPAAVAWYRESGAQPGYHNRAARKHHIRPV